MSGDGSNVEETAGSPVPEGADWLKHITSSEEQTREKFFLAWSLREQVYTNHYGEPLSREYVMGIKNRLEEKATRRDYLDFRQPVQSIVVGDDASPEKFYEVKTWLVDRDGKRHDSHVEVLEHVGQEIERIGSIELGIREDDLPKVNAYEHSNVVTIQDQITPVEERRKTIQDLKMDDLDHEFVELCASQGITSEELMSLRKLDLPDPQNPNRKLYGTELLSPLGLMGRTLRNNHNDVFLLAIINKALDKGRLVSETELADANFRP